MKLQYYKQIFFFYQIVFATNSEPSIVIHSLEHVIATRMLLDPNVIDAKKIIMVSIQVAVVKHVIAQLLRTVLNVMIILVNADVNQV